VFIVFIIMCINAVVLLLL